jgi:tyrosinase
MVVTLGPSTRFYPHMPQVPPNPRADALGSNPRCIRRDVNPRIMAYARANVTAPLIAGSPDMDAFQSEFQRPLGVHAAGHLSIGGDPGGDFFVGTSDPLFYLHHGEVDRVYWTWQNHGLPERWSAVAGTVTMRNEPPSRNGTLDDVIDVGHLGPQARLGELTSTMGGFGGLFCYLYK